MRVNYPDIKIYGGVEEIIDDDVNDEEYNIVDLVEHE